MQDLVQQLKTALQAGDYEKAVQIREEIALLTLQISAELNLERRSLPLPLL